MTAPAAPLEKAVEEAREALAHHATCPGEGKWRECSSSLATALRSLLAALDADKRLEEAEEAIEHARQAAHGGICQSILDDYVVARRALAPKGEDRG